jgi:hypothetical protein
MLLLGHVYRSGSTSGCLAGTAPAQVLVSLGTLLRRRVGCKTGRTSFFCLPGRDLRQNTGIVERIVPVLPWAGAGNPGPNRSSLLPSPGLQFKNDPDPLRNHGPPPSGGWSLRGSGKPFAPSSRSGVLAMDGKAGAGHPALQSPRRNSPFPALQFLQGFSACSRAPSCRNQRSWLPGRSTLWKKGSPPGRSSGAYRRKLRAVRQASSQATCAQ